MAIIRHEINIINEASWGAGTYYAVNVRLTPANYSGTCTWYLEVSGNAFSGTYSIFLGDWDENVHATLNFTETSPIVKRVEFSTPPTEDIYFMYTSGDGVAYTARLVCLQDVGDSCTGSESQFEIGASFSTTSTTPVPLSKPKYFTFNANNWDALSAAYFDVSGMGNASATATFYLEEDDGSWGNWTAIGSTTLTGYGYSRSSDLLSGFTDGRHYRLTLKTASASYSVDCYTAKIVLVQSGTVTKLEETMIMTTYGNAEVSGLESGCYAKYLSTDWTDCSVEFRYAHDALNTADSTKLYNVTDSTDISSAITGANQQVSSPITVPDSGDILGVYILDTTGQVCFGRLLAYVSLVQLELTVMTNAATDIQTDQVTLNGSLTIPEGWWG